MKRRDFLKLGSVSTASVLLPANASAAVDFGKVSFDASVYEQNAAQTIMIFLYGGPSELGGNLTNIESIKAASQSSYDNYFRGLTPTSNNFWQEAGGTAMEAMLSNGDMNIFRTCYSQIRENENNRSHGSCVSQNQRGVLHDNDSSGIFSILAAVLANKGMIDENSKLPFISMEGESEFFTSPDLSLASYLRPMALTSELDNPYERGAANQWFYYTDEERKGKEYKEYSSVRALFDVAMDSLAQKRNGNVKIAENFDKRVELDAFINQMKAASTPSSVTYPENSFAEKLETAVKIMANNPDTKVISLGSGGLGGWDDHNEARDYPTRMEALFSAIESAMAHIKAEGKEETINIVVWGDFGRNVNLNSAQGWDHGNLQNLYLFGGKRYFNHVGVVGSTAVNETNSINRMYLQPKTGSYWFEPSCVAATLYQIYGITNPEYLTGGHGVIQAGLLR